MKKVAKIIGGALMWIAIIVFVLFFVVSCTEATKERYGANAICSEYFEFDNSEILELRSLFSGDEKIMCYNDDGETLIVDLQKE